MEINNKEFDKEYYDNFEKMLVKSSKMRKVSAVKISQVSSGISSPKINSRASKVHKPISVDIKPRLLNCDDNSDKLSRMKKLLKKYSMTQQIITETKTNKFNKDPTSLKNNNLLPKLNKVVPKSKIKEKEKEKEKEDIKTELNSINNNQNVLHLLPVKKKGFSFFGCITCCR